MSDKKFAMISQPMYGVPPEDVSMARKNAIAELERMGYDVNFGAFVPLYFEQFVKNKALFWLGVSLQNMAECDAVYFCKGWDHARGCLIEHEAAMAYGLEVLYEE